MMRQLWPYLMRYKVRLFSGVLFVVLANLFGILTPLIVKNSIDYVKNDVVLLTKLLNYAGLLILFTVISGFFRFLMRRTIIVVSRFIENDLRNDLFEKLETLDMAYYQRNNTGDIMSRLTNDLNAIRSVLGPGVMYTINLVTTFIFVTFMMLRISPLMTLIALLPVPLVAIVVNRFGAVIHRRYLAVQQQFARISTKAQENLAGIRIVKSYVLEESELKDFNRLNQDYIEKNMAHARAQAGFQPSMMLIIGMGSALILLFGGKLIINNVISLGDFVAFLLYIGMLVFPSIALGWVLGIFLQGTAAQKRLNDILHAKPDIYDDGVTEQVESIFGQVDMRGLTFAYPRYTSPTLVDINLSVKQGEIIAIVGKTGSGKTSLMRLITREFDAPQNSLFIDGKEIHHIPLKTLRYNIGYIPQETFLFSDSIASNIAFGVKDPTPEDIRWAAKTANIHDTIIELPDAYDTMLGERGINLSGGQKQRLAIARAILKRPKILLLDDALSAVDTITEETILTNLREVMTNRTCFWVSHRISSIKNVDKIIVLDNGRIVESGTHDELLLLNGIYADLYEKQQLEDTLMEEN